MKRAEAKLSEGVERPSPAVARESGKGVTKTEGSKPKYPGTLQAMDGTTAVVAMETAASEAAGAYPITPSTQMGEGWAEAAAEGRPNVFGRRLIFFEPEGEHAAAAVTAGLSLVGLRSANFSAGQGIAYMHESLYAAVGKRLTYVLNVAARAMTKHALNIHCAHDDYHAVDDTGFFQLFAKNAQEAADLNLIAHRLAELALNPGLIAQDGFLTSHVLETLHLPEPELVREFLGAPEDMIESPTPAQKLIFGEHRRRIPELFDLDKPAVLGSAQNQESYAQGVAAQRPFFFDHVAGLADRAFDEFARLTGRHYARTTGYRVEDAEYIILAQGSVIPTAEVLCDRLREEGRIRAGVVNLTMFRPFPADLITYLLKGKRGVAVLERVDQPLAVDPPMMREVRSAILKALENGRATKDRRPHPSLAAYRPEDAPEFYSGCFGLGSHEVQSGDLVAALENMLPGGHGRRQFYLGIDFIREGTRHKQLAEWQDKIRKFYPHVADLSLPTSGEIHLMPKDALALRIHSVGGWGAITMGKNLALLMFEMLGLHIKANPKYGSEKKGQPTTFSAVASSEPIRPNGELRRVDVVLSPDPNSFLHSNPLAGLRAEGTLVLQSDREPEAAWQRLPRWARQTIREQRIQLFVLDGFKIAQAEASDPDLRYRMQGAAFQGAFLRITPLMGRHGISEQSLFERIRHQLEEKFGSRGPRVVEDNFRVVRRGYDEVREINWASVGDAKAEEERHGVDIVWQGPPSAMDGEVADPHRFLGQVCELYRSGEDPIAEPFSTLGAIPAATGALRDLSGIRLEVPQFVAENCTGCGQCWVQCPDAAIPGLVVEIESLLETGARLANKNGGELARFKTLLQPLANEIRTTLTKEPFVTFRDLLCKAYVRVAPALDLKPEDRTALNGEFDAVASIIADLPLAQTSAFFSIPERKEARSGGLLAVTVNPYACKGCMLCVEVCPDNALVRARQEDHLLDPMRHQWAVWDELPDTPNRFLKVRDMKQGIGVLHTLLLKKKTYRSLVCGDSACMGCGEKTATHLIVSAVEAAMQDRVERFVKHLDELLAGLQAKTGSLPVEGADVRTGSGAPVRADVDLPGEPQRRLDRIRRLQEQLKDLKWRYTNGPSGRGRAALGIANATGCSSIWGSTFPYNPYPYPWVNHLFQDSPSIAIGLFEGLMRKMADAFAAIRRAELEIKDGYDPSVHEKEFAAFDWQKFTDDEFMLCPPIFAIGGDGAMLDIGFQNLSRLLASGKPLRVIVLDTQVYSNTGGQASTATFAGQVADMAAFGGAQHGKTEQRKELSLLAIAHRGAYVLQSSQALPSHLIGGVLRGLHSRRPAVFNIYTPCQPEHGLPDDGSENAARLALESRAFPFLIYDPDGGPSLADRLDLARNPDAEAQWPAYKLEYVDEKGESKTMSLPMTTADWAATEMRFAKHFKKIAPDTPADRLVPFHEFIALKTSDREGKTPFIYTLNAQKRLDKRSVSPEIVRLTEDRMHLWAELKEMAGLSPATKVRDAVGKEIQAKYEQQLAVARKEAETARATSEEETVKRIVQGLLSSAAPQSAPAKQPAAAAAAPAPKPAAPKAPPASSRGNGASVEPQTAPVPAAAAAAPKAEAASSEPHIDSALCTTCDECTRLNPRMFVYNADKQAYIKDPRAGTYQELVRAAELCPASIIHPGTPLNPSEKDLDQWTKRAEPFR
ncbi:MAG: 2-oxoacid:acceptor oxidoreductase family protein [Nitrospirae bacterium]|nr:2-oxoacid:acceptor oxidoreductase family protein [Nitrospirota bacterium]